ncbi:MAG: sensor histidine kinase [Patescibacteria group bacterium]|nr:HAMP domain-containing protein [Patescibacteria group bacterium]MDE2014954.1 sensor histidine kinase [Patescibacteria group bacterium]MDE2226383.1 sensor histidine kinase [Patescibacteria group bacterium]
MDKIPEERRPKGRLRNKIFLVIASVSVVPIVIAGLISVYSIRESHKVDVANLESVLIDQKYGEIRNFINGITGVIEVKVATDKTDDSDFTLSTKKFLLKQFLSTIPPLEDVAFIGSDGKEVAKFSREYPDGVPDDQLKDWSGSPELSSAHTGIDYFGAAHFTGKGPVMEIAGPNVNNGNVPISAVVADVNLSQLQDIVKETSLGASGYVYLVDDSGELIGGMPNTTSSIDLRNTAIVSAVISGENFLGASAQERYLNHFGAEVVAAARYLPEFKWGLIAEWPTSEADASVNDILYKNILLSGAVLVLVIIVSIIFAIILVRPIKALEKGTELVSQGKFEERVKINTGDELEELGNAFNKMIAGLKQLQELKDEFVFIAAHELRTPVAAIRGYLSLVLDGVTGPITDKTKDLIKKVINSNQRLIQLVNDLLEVSRSEVGKLTIKVAAIDIEEPIDVVMNELRPLAEDKSVEMSYEIPENLPKVMADSDRVKEVMTNLVGNAIKYNNDGGWVRVKHEVKNKMLITYVTDNGFGMAPEAQKKLFEKFYRVQTEKTQNITGTGLGLFIVKQIVEKMGGKIWGESEGEGKGSTFGFSLPIAR